MEKEELRSKNYGRLFKIAAGGLLVVGLSLYSLFLIRNSHPAPQTFEQQIANAQEANAAALSPEASAAASQIAATPFSKTYENADFGFSFAYSDALSVGDSTDSGALTVLAQNPSQHVGMQIYSAATDYSSITQEDIERSLPQIQPHNFAPISLDGTPGLAFAATDPNFGDSLQIWLVHRGYLYQISTYATQGALVSKMLGTWKWVQ